MWPGAAALAVGAVLTTLGAARLHRYRRARARRGDADRPFPSQLGLSASQVNSTSTEPSLSPCTVMHASGHRMTLSPSR